MTDLEIVELALRQACSSGEGLAKNLFEIAADEIARRAKERALQEDREHRAALRVDDEIQ